MEDARNKYLWSRRAAGRTVGGSRTGDGHPLPKDGYLEKELQSRMARWTQIIQEWERAAVAARVFAVCGVSSRNEAGFGGGACPP